MAREDGAVETVEAGAEAPVLDGAATGWYVRGAYLGLKREAPYTIEGRSGTSRPKLGLQVDGEEVAVICGDERELFDLTVRRGIVKGDVISLRVFGKTGRFGTRWGTSPDVLQSASWE